jgi:hypothetical protein
MSRSQLSPSTSRARPALVTLLLVVASASTGCSSPTAPEADGRKVVVQGTDSLPIIKYPAPLPPQSGPGKK